MLRPNLSCFLLGLKLAQVGLKLPQVGPKLAQVGFKLVQVGPKLAPSWHKLPQDGPSWPKLAPNQKTSFRLHETHIFSGPREATKIQE